MVKKSWTYIAAIGAGLIALIWLLKGNGSKYDTLDTGYANYLNTNATLGLTESQAEEILSAPIGTYTNPTLLTAAYVVQNPPPVPQALVTGWRYYNYADPEYAVFEKKMYYALGIVPMPETPEGYTYEGSIVGGTWNDGTIFSQFSWIKV
jgi:hypothetical protein